MIRHAMRLRRHVATAAAVTYVSLFMAPAAHASGSSMPWAITVCERQKTSPSWASTTSVSPVSCIRR